MSTSCDLKTYDISKGYFFPLTSLLFLLGNHGELDPCMAGNGFVSHGSALLRCPIKTICHGKHSWLTDQLPHLWGHYEHTEAILPVGNFQSITVRWGCYGLAMPTWWKDPLANNLRLRDTLWPGGDCTVVLLCDTFSTWVFLSFLLSQVSDLQCGLKVLPTYSCSRSLYFS